MFGLGLQELIIILLIILFLFGAKKLPEIARSLGKAKKEFEKAGKDIKEELEEKDEEKKDQGSE